MSYMPDMVGARGIRIVLCMGKWLMKSPLAQLLLAEQDTGVTEHMTQVLGHTKVVFYHKVSADLDSGFCYLVEVADFVKLEPVEVADI